MLRPTMPTAAVIVFALAPAAVAAEAKEAAELPQNTWREVLGQFRAAACLAHAGNVADARQLPAQVELTSRPPYNRLARQLVWKLQSFEASHQPIPVATIRDRATELRSLAAYDLSLIWTREALKQPDDPYTNGLHSQAAWLLYATGDYKASLAEFDYSLKHLDKARGFDRQKIVDWQATIRLHLKNSADVACRLAMLQKINLDGFHGNGQADGNQAHKLLTALESLVPLLEETNDSLLRKGIHGSIQTCLSSLGDLEGLTAWEELMLFDPAMTGEEVAAIAAARRQRAHELGRFAEAESNWRLICEKHPKSKQYGIAQFNLGYVLQEQDKIDQAIAEYLKLLPSEVNDHDAGANIMEAYRNYRNRAAKQLAKCYEAKGDPRGALQWALLARDKYRYASWCGTCQESESRASTANIIRLTAKSGSRKEAVEMAEQWVFDKDVWHAPAHVLQLIVDEYFAAKRSADLLARIEKQRDVIFASGRANDGHSDATRFMVEYLEVLALAERDDREGLWAWIQQRNISANRAMIPEKPRETVVGLAAEELLRNRQALVPFLKRKFYGNVNERAWALVLLAKLGEVKNVEAIHRLVARIDAAHGSEVEEIVANRHIDYFYAILLADPDQADTLRERYENTDLTYAAQNAVGRLRTVALADE